MNEFEKLMTEKVQTEHYYKNQKIKGKIVRIEEDKAFIDIGQKVEAVVKKDEIEGYNVGDEIEAIFTGKKNKDGYFILSRKNFILKDKIEKIRKAFEKKERVKATIIGTLEKGYVVDIDGLKGFMPFSLAGLKRDEKLPEGYTFEAYIVKFEEGKNRLNLIVSRKDVLLEEKEKEKEKYLSLLKEGQKVTGKVEKIEEKVAVISLDGIVYGILPKSELSWNKDKTFEDILKVGDSIEVVVKEIKDGKPIFSLKMLEKNPWDKFDKNVGDMIYATVKEINKFGIVVNVDGVEGFIHNNEIDYLNPFKAKKNYKVGSKVEAKITELDKEKRKLKLSIKQTKENPIDNFLKEHPIGSLIEAKVKDVKQKVAFIDLGDIEGVIKLEDITDNKVKSISSLLNEGKVYKFKVLGVDRDKIILGMKQILEENWDSFTSKYNVGDVITVKVKKLINKGAFVDITENLEGFIPLSEISVEKINIPSDKLHLNEEVKAKIINIDKDRKKITLSIKQLILDEEKRKKEEEKKKLEEESKKKLLEKFTTEKSIKEPDSESLGTLGELLKKKLERRKS